MPEQKEIPTGDNVGEVTTESDLNTAINTNHQTIFHITKDAKINNNDWHFYVDNAVVYVEGEFNVNIAGKNNTIYVYPGGKITNGKCFLSGSYGDYRYIYNYGGTVTQPIGYTIAATTYMTTGDFELTGQNQGTIYVGGNLTVNTGNSSMSHSGTIAVKGDVDCKETFNFGGNPYTQTLAQMQVDGTFTAPDAYINTYGDVTVGCSMNITNTLQVNGAYSSLNLLNGGYVKAKNIIWTESANITIENKGMINGTESVAIKTVGNGTITLNGDNAVGAVVTSELITNSNDMNPVFKLPGTASQLVLKYDKISGTGNLIDGTDVDLPPNVVTKNSVNFSDIVIKKTGCNDEGLNDDGNDPTPDPKKPTLDYIAQVDPVHTHPISATCVDYANGKAYLSWHARGVGQAGCLEILDHSSLESPKLVSYLQAYTQDTERDSQDNIDYNHCIVDNNILYAVGNRYNKGGHLSYVKLASDGTFDDNLEYDAYEETTEDLLKSITLTTGNKQSCDGNCIIRQGDDFLVASTSGFETFNASTLESTNFVPTSGKGKHIATDGKKILTLNYLTTSTNEEDALTAVVNVYDKDDHTFSSPKKVASSDLVQPNNGKNTIKIDGDYAYVCLAKNGLARYNINDGTPEYFKLDRITLANGTDVIGAACNGVDVDEKYVYVAYGSFGLHVLDKTTLEEVASYVNSGGNSANYVKVVKRDGVPYIYIAYGESGLKICRLIEQ